MKNGEMKTLRVWFDELKISLVYTFLDNGYIYDTYKSDVKKVRNGYIDIYTKGGNCLSHNDIDKYFDDVFFIQNVDNNDIELYHKFW